MGGLQTSLSLPCRMSWTPRSASNCLSDISLRALKCAHKRFWEASNSPNPQNSIGALV